MLAVVLALATSPESVVQWDAPGQCPDAAAVVHAIERYVGRSVAAESVTARGHVEAVAEGFRLELTIAREGAAPDRRMLRDADCAVLSDAAALIVAVAIDPEAAGAAMSATPALDPSTIPDPVPTREPAPAEPAPAEPAEPAPTEPAPAEPAPTPAPASTAAANAPPARRSCAPGRSSLTDGPLAPACASLGASVILQVGPLPRFGPAVGGSIALLWPRLALEVGGAHHFTQPAREADGQRGGDVRLSIGDARACGRLAAAQLEFPLCAGVEAGVLRGIGIGIDDPQEDRLPWVAAIADAALAWAPVRRIAVSARVGAVVPLSRYRFLVDGLGEVHRAAPVGLRVGLGVQTRLP